MRNKPASFQVISQVLLCCSQLNDVQRKGPLGPLPLFVCPLVERMEELAELRGAEEGCMPLDQMTVRKSPKP